MPNRGVYITDSLEAEIAASGLDVPYAALLKKAVEEFLREQCPSCGQFIPPAIKPKEPVKKVATKKVAVKAPAARKRISIRR